MPETKCKIIELLESTKRDGIRDLLFWMEYNGFYTAPCSSQYHLCKEGGLAEHSLNVFNVSLSMRDALMNEISSAPYISLVICALLHDLGKCGQFGKQNYIENMISDRKGGYRQSDKKPYTSNPELLYVPHEVRSIQIASQFIKLTEEENWAILMHNGMYGDFKYTIQGKETPLYLLLHFADLWCSRVIEKESEDGTEI